jgi:hypothetical protein
MRTKLISLTVPAVLALVVGCGSSSSSSPAASSSSAAATASASPTPAFAYPPVTHADFVALAATGHASDILYIKPIVTQSGDCPETVATVSISPTLPPTQQMADLARVFLDQKFDQGCGGILLAFFDAAKAAAADATADLSISLFQPATPHTIKMAPINGQLVTVPAS